MKKLRPIIDFLIFSNIFIALAAVCFILETLWLLGIPLKFYPYLFIVFFATLFEYCLHRFIWIRKKGKQVASFRPAEEWALDHPQLFQGTFLFALAGLLISALFARKEVLLFLIPFAFITLGYSLPFIKRQNKIIRLRDIPAAKIILISVVWSVVTVFLPVVQAGLDVMAANVIWLAVQRIVFVFAITLPFDIRDAEMDKMAGIKTLPVLFGEKTALIIASAALADFILLILFQAWMQGGWNEMHYALIVSALITFVLFWNKRIRGNRYYHYGFLDGAIILQALLVGVVELIK